MRTSYLKHRAKRLAYQRAYDRKHRKTRAASNRRQRARPAVRVKAARRWQRYYKAHAKALRAARLRREIKVLQERKLVLTAFLTHTTGIRLASNYIEEMQRLSVALTKVRKRLDDLSVRWA